MNNSLDARRSVIRGRRLYIFTSSKHDADQDKLWLVALHVSQTS